MNNTILKIAIQKTGRLKEPSLAWLNSLGLNFANTARQLVAPCLNASAKLVLVRNRDIWALVQSGIVDCGITGENILKEYGAEPLKNRGLAFGGCKLVIATPKNSIITNVKMLNNKCIATSYPNSLNKFLAQNAINASVVEMKGSVEVAPELGLADAICDITQSGKTLKENSLEPIFTIYNSRAVLIKNPKLDKKKQAIFDKLLYENILSK